MVKILVGIGMAMVLLFWLLAPIGRSPLQYLGAYEIPTGDWIHDGVPVGEISGLAYDPVLNLFFAVSDNRGDTGPPGRLYSLDIQVDLQGIHGVDVFEAMLLDSDAQSGGIQPYEIGDIDAEEVVFTPNRYLIVSSERDRHNRPWIRVFNETANLLKEIEIPTKFIPAEDKGVRENLAFEAMTLTPDGETLYVANEQALVQDGPTATVDHGTTVRLLKYDLSIQTPSLVAEYPYVTEPVFEAPQDTYADNGVTAILYVKHVLPRYDLLVLERAYSSGVGNDIKLFGVNLNGADDVRDLDVLPFPYDGSTVEKELLVRISAIEELSDIPIEPDNVEAMTLGPQLSNGHPILLLASDNNFNDSQRNLFLAFEIVR